MGCSVGRVEMNMHSNSPQSKWRYSEGKSMGCSVGRVEMNMFSAIQW